ncbi:MAG: protoporphyrinogen oxidase [Opitutaceae bacterium]
MPKTCIIGAGISGLALAWQIKRQGGDCTILEQAQHVGGAMQSFRDGDYLAEEGPNSILLNSAAIEAFLYSIPKLKERIVEAAPEANKRFIVRNGQPHAVPMGPLSAITTPLWSLAGKFRVLKEPFIKAIDPNKEESVADFVRRRLGEELYQYAINPLVGGIYAGDPEKLSLRYGFPKLYALEQQHGGLIRGAIAKMRASKKDQGPKIKKRIISFIDGMGELPEKLADALQEVLQTSVSIDSIRRDGNKWSVEWNSSFTEEFDEVILTIPAHKTRSLPFEAELKDAFRFLETIDYPPVSVLTLAYKRKDIKHPLDGFGALVPACEQREILGTLFPSSLFKERAPNDEALLTVFVGGERQPELATADTEALKAIVCPELKSLLGINGEPTFCHHKHWSQAIPQYKLGYGDVLDKMNTIESKYPGLRLAGNYRTGISVSNCIEAALDYTQ